MNGQSGFLPENAREVKHRAVDGAGDFFQTQILSEMFAQEQSGPLGLFAVNPKGGCSMSRRSNAPTQVSMADHCREQVQREFIEGQSVRAARKQTLAHAMLKTEHLIATEHMGEFEGPFRTLLDSGLHRADGFKQQLRSKFKHGAVIAAFHR